jgi:UDP-N-acetylglucosamine 2-epimerase (hydrolysing)
MKKKNILFLTGTRADFGKLKPLLESVNTDGDFEMHLFVTGMHELKLYGYTTQEVLACGYKNVYRYINQFIGSPMEIILANTIQGLSRYVHENRPDMIVVHGDRVEALAGAIVGIMQNILVAHIEGGERSGTVDEMIRHSVSKLSHIHFVANKEAAYRLRQMGERENSIHVIGSPDIDMMVSNTLPPLGEVKDYYGIPFERYAVALFHPVTTEQEQMAANADKFVQAMLEDMDNNYVVIYPNNDEGTHDILNAYKRLEGNPRFRIYPSIRFEKFLTLLKHARFCIGNSSAGIREAPFYGIPTVNIGTRQFGRFEYPSIIDTSYEVRGVMAGINKACALPRQAPALNFGAGNSTELFMRAIKNPETWQGSTQKVFFDYLLTPVNSNEAVAKLAPSVEILGDAV